MLIVPPATGRVIISGLNLNSLTVTSTLAAAAGPPDAPEADSLLNPNIAKASAITETTNANQPSTDLSSFAMGVIVTAIGASK
jgi:hypothetical protein